MKYISEPQHLGHLLRNIRHSLGFTRERMSDILGVTERTIQNYETGSTRLTIENWVRCIVIVERQIQGADRAINRKSIPKEVAKIVETILEEDC